MSSPILPGSSLGVLGSGQLGRMFAIAARRLGYRVHVLSPDDDTPAGQVADLEIRAAYDDLDAVAEFARKVSVVTFEFENVPIETALTAEKFAPVRPGGSVLHTTQNRIREKTFLRGQGIPLAPFAVVNSAPQLSEAIEQVGLPGVLKTAAWGYDGKGQRKVHTPDQAAAAFRELGRESVLEGYIDLAAELSVVVARGLDGQTVTYGPIANDHQNHILDASCMPARFDPSLARQAIEIAATIARSLDAIGTLCVEFFLARDGRLLVNEIAPRPHNSGHLTVDACVTCQFEQQVRGICGLPLGAPDQLRPAAMVNLLGDLWGDAEPDWPGCLAIPDAKLHLYGKMEARPGRKMGHITAFGETSEIALERAKEARAALLSRQARSRTAPHAS